MNIRLLRDLENTVEFLRSMPSYLVLGDLGVNLGRGDMFMSQHLRYGFQRYALRERDRCGKSMPRAMERGVERQAGVSGNMP